MSGPADQCVRTALGGRLSLSGMVCLDHVREVKGDGGVPDDGDRKRVDAVEEDRTLGTEDALLISSVALSAALAYRAGRKVTSRRRYSPVIRRMFG